MSIEQAGIIVSILMAFGSLIGVIYFGGYRMGGLEVKVDTMWDYMMRRAESELIIGGLGSRNSPLIVRDEVKLWLESMKAELREFYQKFGRHLSDKELMMEIENKFGDRLLNEVCIPHGLYHGACLIIAAEVAKEE